MEELDGVGMLLRDLPSYSGGQSFRELRPARYPHSRLVGWKPFVPPRPIEGPRQVMHADPVPLLLRLLADENAARPSKRARTAAGTGAAAPSAAAAVAAAAPAVAVAVPSSTAMTAAGAVSYIANSRRPA